MRAQPVNGLVLVSRAADFAAERHRDQRRKGKGQVPYVNHLADVARLLAVATPAGMWQLTARRYLYATGAHEQSALFVDNDRPGVMLAASAQHYVNRFAALPGKRAVVFTKIFRWQTEKPGPQPISVAVIGTFSNWQKVPLKYDRLNTNWQLTLHDIPGNCTHN